MSATVEEPDTGLDDAWDDDLDLAIAALTRVVTGLDRVEPASMTPDSTVEERLVDAFSDLARLSRLVDALRFSTTKLLTLAEREAPHRLGLSRRLGRTSVGDLLSAVLGTGRWQAHEWVRIVTASVANVVVDPVTGESTEIPAVLPHMGRAVARGEIGFERAGAVRRTAPDPTTLDDDGWKVWAAGEAALTRLAAGTYEDRGAHGATAHGALDSEGRSPSERDAGEWHRRHPDDLPVHYAAPVAPEALRAAAQEWAALADPVTEEQVEARQRAARSFSIRELPDGSWRLNGTAPRLDGAIIAAACAAATSPRRGNGRPEEPEGEPPTSTEERTPDQLRFDFLRERCSRFLESSGAEEQAGTPTTVLITTTLQALTDHLQAETARGFHGQGASPTSPPASDRPSIDERLGWLMERYGESGARRLLVDERFAHLARGHRPLGMAEVTRLFCNATLELLLTDGTDQPLRLLHLKRDFTPAQKRALAARDRHCQAPGCFRPAADCEAHHAHWHSLGGPTDVSNGLLLCSVHHHEVHERRLVVLPVDPDLGSPIPFAVVSVAPDRGSGRKRRRRRAARRQGERSVMVGDDVAADGAEAGVAGAGEVDAAGVDTDGAGGDGPDGAPPGGLEPDST